MLGALDENKELTCTTGCMTAPAVYAFPSNTFLHYFIKAIGMVLIFHDLLMKYDPFCNKEIIWFVMDT